MTHLKPDEVPMWLWLRSISEMVWMRDWPRDWSSWRSIIEPGPPLIYSYPLGSDSKSLRTRLINAIREG